MRRILYLYLPDWPIDRLRRVGVPPARNGGARPADGRSRASIAVMPAGAGAELPFATVVAAQGRRRLAAVNPAAAAHGLAAGMPLADALSFVPGLATRPAEPAEDAAALRRLAEWCGRYSPWTAPDCGSAGGPDGIKIETTGSAHLWGGEAELAADLSARLARQCLVHRLALADTLGAAWALARFAAGDGAPAIVASGETRAALAPLPVAALRLDPETAEGLRQVGLRQVGDVLAMPRDALARRFGEAVAARLDQALGNLPEPLSPLGEVPARRVRLSLPEPIADPADLARAAERLSLDLVSRLAREGTGARRLDLAFHRVDGRVEHIRIGTARPSRDPAHLAGLLVGRLDTVDPGLGIEDVILSAFAVETLPAEQFADPRLLGRNPHSASPPLAGERGRRRPLSPSSASGAGPEPDLAPLLDRFGARLGLDAVARIEARASHIPERASVAAAFTENPFGESPRPRSGEAGRAREAGKAGADSHPIVPDAIALSRIAGESDPPPQKPPRPVRLFTPPEPVAAVWELPDHPPVRFDWRRRQHRVARADGPERIAEEWWRPDGRVSDGDGVPDAIRDYYRVEDDSGRRFWLFRAGLPGDPPPRWFLHGLFA